MRTIIGSLGVLATLAATSTGCGAPADQDRAPVEQRPTAPSARLLAADSHGAIVIDGQPLEIRGVDRSGDVLWRKEPDGDGDVSCSVRCPDITPPAGAGYPRQRVLAADGVTSVIVNEGPGIGSISVWAGHTRTAEIPVAAGPTTWRATSDNSAAVAVTGTEVRTFVRTSSGWQPRDTVHKSTSGFACVAPGGAATIIADPAPTLLGRRRVELPYTEYGSACDFAANGAIIAENSVSADGARTRIATVTRGGRLLWSRAFDTEVRVHADATSDQVLLVHDGVVSVRTLHGVESATHADADDARFDEHGDVVIVDRAGRVTWVPRTN